MHVLAGRAGAGAQDALPRRRRPRIARVLRPRPDELEAHGRASRPGPPFRSGRPPARAGARLAFLGASLALHLALLLWARAEISARAPVRLPIPIAWVEADEAPGPVAAEAPPAAAPPTPPLRPSQPPRPPPRARTVRAAPPPVASDAGAPPASVAPEPSAPGSGANDESGAASGASEFPPSDVAIALPRGGYQVRPVYPARSRAAGVEGTTRLRVLVTTHGRVAEVRLEESAGDPDLDRAALRAVRRWRFEPLALPPDAPGVWVIVPIHFRLSEER